MCERRGYAILIQGGNPEISGALSAAIESSIRPSAVGGANSKTVKVFDFAAGMLEGRAAQRRPYEGNGERLTEEEKRVVSAEMDRQIIAEMLSIALHREPVDYAEKRFDAEMAYGESLYEPGLLKKMADKLLVAYAMAYLRIRDYFDWERREWRGE